MPGPSSSGRRPSDEDEDDDLDVEIVEVIRPSSPLVITLSESDEEREEELERNEASSSSSRGKALKQRSSPGNRVKVPQRTKSAKKEEKEARSISDFARNTTSNQVFHADAQRQWPTRFMMSLNQKTQSPFQQRNGREQ